MVRKEHFPLAVVLSWRGFVAEMEFLNRVVYGLDEKP